MNAPILIGVLNDMAESPPIDGGQGGIEHAVRAAVEPLVASGRITRDVELVPAYGLGLPRGTAAAVQRAFADLDRQNVLAILGPAIGDNALVATPLAEHYAIPTINFAGTERARSHWMFHLQVGSHEDESLLLARHIASTGARRVGIVYDRSPIGKRHLRFFQDECELLGVTATDVAPIAATATDALDAVRSVLSDGLDAVLYLGLGLSTPAVDAVLRRYNVRLPKFMNTAGMRGYDPAYGALIDGWTYVDMVSDDNRVLQSLAEATSGTPGPAVAYGRDMGILIAEGLARASELTRDGVREGLENIKWLPAAEGHEGTLLSFGNHDRGALHGRYLVLRTWIDGKSIQCEVNNV
jgi:branched-chain amino acid transport system substrate-binding protein